MRLQNISQMERDCYIRGLFYALFDTIISLHALMSLSTQPQACAHRDKMVHIIIFAPRQ
jgi:hypothetical protein